MLPARGSVLGIDIGCSPIRKSSAVCRLDWDESRVKWSIERFRAVEPERAQTIERVASNAPLSAAAFDGPLRQGLDVIGRYRTAERMLTRRLQPLIGKPGQSSAPVGKLLNAHANDCARIVLDSCNLREVQHSVGIHERAIAEAFPSSFLGVLIEQPEALNARRGDRSDTFFQYLATAGIFHKLIAHLLPGRSLVIHPSTVTNHDDRAALVCALTALCVAAGDFVAVGDDNGWIILPPVTFVQSWALGLLETNAAGEETPALHVENGLSSRTRQASG
jgi:hypothetical protein